MSFHAFWVSTDHGVGYFASAAAANVKNLSFVDEALGNIFQIHFHNLFINKYPNPMYYFPIPTYGLSSNLFKTKY